MPPGEVWWTERACCRISRGACGGSWAARRTFGTRGALDRILPGLAVRTAEELVGGGLVGAVLAVPSDGLAEAVANHAEENGGGGAVADFDVADGEAFLGNGVEEVGPEFFDVLAVGVVELGFDVDDGLAFLGGVPGPAVAPTHVEGAFGAVEVSADEVLFGFVAGVVALFPGGVEGFEFEGDDLGVGGGGRVLAGEAAGGGEDAAGVGFVGPPEELVHPVDAPIAESAVGVVQELAEAAGVDSFVEGALGGGAEPEIPVESGGGGGVFGLGPVGAGGVSEEADHADLADFTGLEELHAGDGMGADAAVEADLDKAAGFAGGAEHGFAFVDGVGDGFFNVDVGAGADGVDGGEGVPVVGSGDDGDVGTLFLEEFAVVAVTAGLGVFPLGVFGGGFVDLSGVGVGEGDAGALAGGDGFAEDVGTPPARADEGGFELAAGGLREEGGGGEIGEEMAAAHRHHSLAHRVYD